MKRATESKRVRMKKYYHEVQKGKLKKENVYKPELMRVPYKPLHKKLRN